MFCGECGSSTSATPESRRRPDPRPGDTTVLERDAPLGSGVISIPLEGFRSAAPEAAEALEAGQAHDSGAAAETDVTVPGGVEAEARAATTEADAATEWAPEAAAAAPPRVRFVFRFTTGDTRTVFGSGLIGRRPMPQPGESFDHLVQVADRSLSVSKTHLEFGEHDDELWVADRFSANGTVVHRPDDGAVRCEPGRRYLVPRGSRVEIAEHSFRVE